MNVGKKRRRGCAESLYVFEFESQEEFDFYLDGMRCCARWLAALGGEVLGRDFEERFVERAQRRCDGLYAREGVSCSFVMFDNEMADYARWMSELACSMAPVLQRSMDELAWND